MKNRYQITAPYTPGATPSPQGGTRTLAEARIFARKISQGRGDLRGQDVRIEDLDGNLVEYAGPAREIKRA
jgi:hypothetical protein